jgi:hypothetical protein
MKLRLKRVRETNEALASWNLNDISSGGWTLGSEYFGVTTHYKTTSDGLLTIRMESMAEDMPIFEQLAVINEVDFFKEWVREINIRKVYLGMIC